MVMMVTIVMMVMTIMMVIKVIKLMGLLARDNLAQDGQKLCPWLDSLILAHTDQKICLSFSVWDGRKHV